MTAGWTVRGRRLAGVLVLLAAAGLAIAIYLLVTKLAGGLPICGPLGGCETVATSRYSEVLGIPVAAFGTVYSAILLGLTLAWWRLGDRRALYGAYAFGLMGILAVVYLTYLELFVIHAICVWCVTYGATIVVGWLLAAWELRRAP